MPEGFEDGVPRGVPDGRGTSGVQQRAVTSNANYSNVTYALYKLEWE